MTKARYCCDGKCLDNQGRGTCPQDQDTAPAPHYEYEDQSQGLTWQERIQFTCATVFAICVLGACVSCVFFGGPK